MEKKKKEKAPKPKYNAWQNSCYMIKLAWREKERKILVFSFLSACLAVASNIVNLYVSPTILSAIEQRVSFTELLLTIGFFVGAMMLCSAASSYITQNAPYGKITLRMALTGFLVKKTATTSYSNLDDDAFLKLNAEASAACNYDGAATQAIWTTLTGLLQNILGFSLYVYLLSTVQPLLLVVILATTVTSYYINRYTTGYGYRHRDESGEIQKKVWYTYDHCVREYHAAKDIRIFGMRPWLEEVLKKGMDAYIAFQKRVQSVVIWSRIADLVLTFLRNGIAYAYLIYLVVEGDLTASQFLLYFSAVGGFTAWVNGILFNFGFLHTQSLVISTVREALDYPEPFRFEDGETLEPEKGRQYEIRLEHVSYRYPNAEHDTLTDINLTLHPGEKLAVVGLNGAGKTTLVKLLCGFLDPTEGRVLLDGKDIKEYNRRDYYRMFSAVFQSFNLLAATVAANVAQTEENIDMERVIDCVEKAGLRGKIESLPGQYDDYLNRKVYEDATELSGGETQRLMLARALYKDAPIIVLDEPTAALDPIAESDMYQKYNEMTAGKSAVYISHRLASTRFCDRLILIENASIAEEGTHEELMRRGGRYAELFAVQSKYYQEGDGEDEG